MSHQNKTFQYCIYAFKQHPYLVVILDFVIRL